MANFLREWVFGSLDRVVYWAVEKIFQLIMDLANLEIFSQSVITEFANRIYIILGLVMLFKIIMSFIQMLIDPDKMSDKEKGVRNILTRVVISLGLIVLVPTIFSTARQVQNYIVPVIPRVLLGVTIDPSQDEEADETMASIGRMMAFYSFLPFFNYDNPSCDHGEILGTGIQLGETEAVPEIYSVSSAIDHVNDKCDASTAKNGYKYNYRWLLSTLVGAYLVYVLVSVAVAIAVRALKFGICEFIAPIPIASYVDPKTSKQAFDNWVSTSIKTYLDLFIRLIIVYFVVFVFMTVFDNENLSIMYAKLNNDSTRYTLVTLFVIVGLLQFVKQAPKFISDMLGLKGSGDFMGMFKGEGWKAIGETGKVAANLAKAPISNWMEMSNTVYSNGKKPGFMRKVGSSVAGLASVTGRTAAAIATGKSGAELTKNPFDNTTKRRNDRIATKNRRLSGYSWQKETAENWRRAMNISAKDDWAQTQYSDWKELTGIVDDLGALGLKKGEEQKYNIKSSLLQKNADGELVRGILGNLLEKNDISYTALSKIAEMKEGDPWDGKILNSSAITEAQELVLKQQRNNKIEFSSKLIGDGDSSAIQIRNRLIDHFRNAPIYNDRDSMKPFVEKIFNGKEELSFKRINEKGEEVTDKFKASTFTREDMINLVTYHLNNAFIQKAIKEVGEDSRGRAQLEASAAERRNKARQGSNN